MIPCLRDKVFVGQLSTANYLDWSNAWDMMHGKFGNVMTIGKTITSALVHWDRLSKRFLPFDCSG